MVHGRRVTSSAAAPGAPRRLLVVGAVLAAVIGVIHLVLVPVSLQQAPAVGVAFLAGGLGPVLAALALLAPRVPVRVKRLAVVLTALACAIMAAAGVAVAFIGLSALLVASIALEVVFLVLTPRLLRALPR